MEIREFTPADIPALVRMRSDVTFEDSPGGEQNSRYEVECEAFLRQAIEGDRWRIWVAEDRGELIGHVFVGLIDRVPRPVAQAPRWAYATNVYVKPTRRGQGVGGAILESVQAWAQAAELELMIVWPSDESRAFYSRHGFEPATEPMIWQIRSEDA